MDGASRYDEFVTFYNGQGIFVYQTDDNISYVVVEGRLGQQNRRLACGATGDNVVPVFSATAMIEFYGECVSLCVSVYVLVCVYTCLSMHVSTCFVCSLLCSPCVEVCSLTVTTGSHTLLL